MNDLLPMARRGLLAAALAATILVPGVALAAGDILGPVTATADKPQSKVWYNDGYYWAILESSDGSHFFKLVSGTWVEEEFVDSRIDHGIEGHEDVLWNGTELFVMVYSSRPRLYKYTYDATLDVYNLLPGFPVSLTFKSLDGAKETMRSTHPVLSLKSDSFKTSVPFKVIVPLVTRCRPSLVPFRIIMEKPEPVDGPGNVVASRMGLPVSLS